MLVDGPGSDCQQAGAVFRLQTDWMPTCCGGHWDAYFRVPLAGKTEAVRRGMEMEKHHFFDFGLIFGLLLLGGGSCGLARFHQRNPRSYLWLRAIH